MNTLYNLALKQFHAVRTDLDRYQDVVDSLAVAGHNGPRSGSTSSSGGGGTTAMQGQIVASLSSLARTIDDYEGMAKREMIREKQDKALGWVARSITKVPCGPS